MAVLVLSNFHDPVSVGTVNSRSPRDHQQLVRVHVPKMIEDYQDNMGGVDLMDQTNTDPRNGGEEFSTIC